MVPIKHHNSSSSILSVDAATRVFLVVSRPLSNAYHLSSNTIQASHQFISHPTMFSRLFFVALLAFAALLSTEAFSMRPAFPALSASSTSLFASRINAKKQKIKRNRENMRKFASPGRRGTTRRKILKKAQASKARQAENEFIAKCFITGPAPNEEDDE